MAAHLLRLRLLSIANLVRFGLRPAASTVFSVLVVLAASTVVATLASRLRTGPAGEVAAIVVGGSSLLLVGFAVAPFARSRPAWSDPRRLYGYPVSTDHAAAGLALAGAVGLPALALLILSFGYVRSFDAGAAIAALAVVSAVMVGVTALLLSLVASTINGMVTTRRARDLLGVGGVVVALVLIPLVVDLVRVAMPGDYEGSGSATSVLATTPFGAAAALPGHAAAGRAGRAAVDLVVALLTLAVLWWVWRILVDRALHRPMPPSPERERVGLGWFDYTRSTAAGAIAARSLTYWVRDARYRWSLVILPFVPVLVVPLGIAGIDWRVLALVPVPVMCLLLGFLPHNDVAYDNTALWMHVSADTRGLADRLGRIAPALAIGVPLAVVGSTVAVALRGDSSAFAPELGVCATLLLSGLGLSSIASAALPYPAVRPGDDPFQQPQAASSAAGWSQSLMIGGTVALSVPAGVLAVLATIEGRADLEWAALWTGLGTGALVLVIGLAIGARVFSTRAPELLAFTLRS